MVALRHSFERNADRHPCAVIAIAADHRIALEDIFGADIGDAITEFVHQHVLRAVPESARMSWGSHQRQIVVVESVSEDALLQICRNIQESVATEPVQTATGPVGVTVAIGAATGTVDDTSGTEKRALRALQQAGETGSGLCLAAEGLVSDEVSIASYARAACGARSEHQVAISFQPVVRADGARIISFHECLARIVTPGGDVVSANRFVPELSRLGLTTMLDRQILAEACARLNEIPTLRLSVNVNRRTMQDRVWLETFIQTAEENPTLAERLIIEISEEVSMLDIPRAETFMETLRPLGVSFAIDDFGTGRASIEHLRNLRFDLVKIDGGVVRGIDRSPDKQFVVETLVGIAQHFEMMIVAEKVETQAEGRTLRDLGVDFFQGFRYGSPSMRLSPTKTPMTSVAAQA